MKEWTCSLWGAEAQEIFRSSDGSPGLLIARLDRIPIWSLAGLFVGIIGVGFLFTFYDIFDINVSFIQTSTQIVPHCSPPSAANYIGPPILLNLVGYAVGTLILGPLADRAGRRLTNISTVEFPTGMLSSIVARRGSRRPSNPG